MEGRQRELDWPLSLSPCLPVSLSPWLLVSLWFFFESFVHFVVQFVRSFAP
jgi:hypothetical protein